MDKILKTNLLQNSEISGISRISRADVNSSFFDANIDSLQLPLANVANTANQ